MRVVFFGTKNQVQKLSEENEGVEKMRESHVMLLVYKVYIFTRKALIYVNCLNNHMRYIEPSAFSARENARKVHKKMRRFEAITFLSLSLSLAREASEAKLPTRLYLL